MLGNIIFIGFVVFSLFQFSDGIKLGIQNPILLLVSIVSIFLLYLLLSLGGGKVFSRISIKKNSLIGRLKGNPTTKILSGTLLLLLAIGNFSYANNWIGTPIANGAEYLEATVLSFISFVILSNKVKNA